MDGFAGSQWGTATNLPTAEYQVIRYATMDGKPAIVAESGRPLQGIATLTTGDGLEISRTGKPGGSPSLTIDPPYRAQDFTATPQGTGIVPDATIAAVRGGKVSVKLAARGYIDPQRMAAREGERGTRMIANDLQFIP